MNTCWKCERTLPEGQVECEYGCAKSASRSSSGPSEAKMAELQDALENRAMIDWSKVKTHADLMLVMSIIFLGVCIDRRSEAAKKLAPFLTEPGAEPTQPQ